MMTKDHKPRKRVQPDRSREGYVMVQMTAADRAKLAKIRDRLEAAHGGRIGLAGALRYLLRKEPE